jgi:hypothetical protein
MQPYALQLLVFFADSRPIEEMRRVVGEALGCEFRIFETDEHRFEDRYVGNVFGMRLSFEQGAVGETKNFYRLLGTSWTTHRFPEAPRVSLDHHVTELLRRVGVTEFISADEYAAAVTALRSGGDV